MRRHFATILISTLIAAPLACGESEETPEVTPSVDNLVQGFCDAAFRCCSAGEVGYFLGPYLNQANCVERLSVSSELSPSAFFSLLQAWSGAFVTIPNLGALDRAAEEGRGAFDTEAVDACVEHLKGLPCNEFEEPPEGCVAPEPPVTDTPCAPRKLFIGKLEAGEECTSGTGSLECEPGLVCRTSGLLGVKGECVRPGDVGDPCFQDLECGPDLYCTQLDGTCQRLRKEGETCVYANRDSVSPSEDTLLLRCEPHLNCDPISDTCVARCQRGAACESDEDCDEEQDLLCISGRCGAKRVEGQPCIEPDDCVEELTCAVDATDPEGATTCQPRLSLSEPCVLHEDCESGFCEPEALQCSAPVEAGSLCPTGLDEQCLDGGCNDTYVPCNENTDCPGSGTCDLLAGTCVPYCVPLKPAGATCLTDAECLTEACVAGFCRELPLADGAPCDLSEQCESEFCSLDDEPVCTQLPLPLGAPCASSTQCESLVCFGAALGDGPECTNGLDENEPCGDLDQAPCDPKRFYCDTERDDPVCVPLLEAGEDCKGSHQCRGDCTLQFSRMMCDATPAPEHAVCDGEDGAE